MKKNYAKPFMAVEVFEPQQSIAVCTGVITYTYKTITGTVYVAPDANENGIFDQAEKNDHGSQKRINPHAEDLVLTGDAQFQQFMNLRKPYFYWYEGQSIDSAQLGWAVQRSQHGELEPFTGGGHHDFVIDYEETYVKSLS